MKVQHRLQKYLRLNNTIIRNITTLFAGFFMVSTILSSLLLSSTASAANANSWKAGLIISDGIFTDSTSMSTSQIQNFLNLKGENCSSNCLKDYSQNGESSASIIKRAGSDYKISPKTLIVLLEKEQSLVTDSSPTSTQYKYATGYCVTDSGLCGNYWGFRLQVRKAAQLFRAIMDDPYESNYPPGTREILYNPRQSCGDKTVDIYNAATSALYHYTPYTPNRAALNNLYGAGDSCSAYGNRNFWRIFTDWFGNPHHPDSYRLIECSDEKYLVERSIKAKRLINEEAIAMYGLENATYLIGDVGCGYGTFGLELGRVVKSRDSVNKYLIDSGNAYRLQGSSIARAWNLTPEYYSELPQLNGTTISGLLDLKYSLPRIAKSSSTNKTYLIDSSKRFQLFGSPSDTNSLRLFTGDGKLSSVTVSSTLLSDKTTSSGTIDYNFNSAGKLYIADYGKIRAINPDHNYRWDSLLDGPSLSTDFLASVPKSSSLTSGYRRDNRYYLVTSTGLIKSTTSYATARKWGVHNKPFISSLLNSKIN